MTDFTDQMAADLEAAIGSGSEAAVAGTYTPRNGDAGSLTCIICRGAVEEPNLDGEGAGRIERMDVMIQTAELASPHRDDSLVISGVTWQVAAVRDKSHGKAICELMRVIPTQRADAGRIRRTT